MRSQVITKALLVATLDLFFKFLMQGTDLDANYLKRVIIEAVLPFCFTSLQLVSANLIPEHANQKNMFLDVLFKDKLSHIIHMEMQRYHLNEDDYARFSSYGFRAYIDQFQSGENYSNSMGVYQIIFVMTNKKTNKLVECYRRMTTEQ